MAIFIPAALPTTVDTVADLATSKAKTADGKIVNTTGRITPGDNGGASYIYHISGRTGVTIDANVFISGPGTDDYFELVVLDECKSKQFGCVGDGVANDRAALVLADAAATTAGNVRITLTAGTYLVSTSLTITNQVYFHKGAKIKPASGATVTLSNGYRAEDTQHVFDISDSGVVSPQKQGYVTPEHFGAAGDGATNDFAAIKACFVAANGAGAVAKSIGDMRTYKIGSRLELDDTYDGLVIDFSNDWIEATNNGWSSNDVLVMKNGAAAYTNSARDYKYYTINIVELNIDGNYDFAGFLSDLEVAYDANPAMSDGDVLTALATATSANGTLYNGFTCYVDPGGTGSANPTYRILAGKIEIKNCGKGGFGVTNPANSHISELIVTDCAGHAFGANQDVAADDIAPNEITITVDNLTVDSCLTAFNLSTEVGAYNTTYTISKLGTCVFGVVNATNILNRTKVHGPWSYSCNVFKSGPQHRSCRYPVFTAVDGIVERSVSIATMSSDTSDGGISGTVRWSLGDIYLKRVKRYAVNIYGAQSFINRLVIDACPYPYRGSCRIGSFKYENTILTETSYQCTASTNYPFYSEGKTEIDRMEIANGTIGTVSVSQTFANYLWYFDLASNGSRIQSLATSYTTAAWPSLTAVTTGELRSESSKLYQSTATRTTRATFDATEQTFWTEVGRGNGQSVRLAYIDDNTSNDYLIEFGEVTGDGYSAYAIQQYSYGVPPEKPSVRIGRNDKGVDVGVGGYTDRGTFVTADNIAQLKALKNVTHGTIGVTRGYTSDADGNGGVYIYQTHARPGSENTLQLYGSGAADWWKAVTLTPATSTTAALASIGNAINTAAKFTGKVVFNTDTLKPVYAVGATAASVWVDATGSTAHTPV